MNILVACEESQVVCSAFRSFGHNAFSCDLLPCSGGHPDWHFHCDVSEIVSTPGSFFCQDGSSVFIDQWDLLIGHPPCTYLSNVSAPRLINPGGYINEERARLMESARDFFLYLWNLPIHRICLENPTPMKYSGLPGYSQAIQPWYFGEPYSKRTCLWLKHLPPLLATCICPDHTSFTLSHRSPRVRSKTFPGIALAMAQQWSFYERR